MKLIVGLGNPGQKYINTRHNIGFVLIDKLRQERSFPDFSENKKLFGWATFGTVDSEKVLLLKPSTYMNRSGKSVHAAAHYYKIPNDNILIIHDEIDFPTAKIALKIGGSHAGHNGLRDIIAYLDTKEFWRLRIGIDRPISKDMVSDYVLSSFSPDQKKRILDQRDIIQQFCRSCIHSHPNQ